MSTSSPPRSSVRTDLRGLDYVSYDRSFELLSQSDGKILAVGESRRVGHNQFRIATVRYTAEAEGALDTGFGSDGIVIAKFAGIANSRCFGAAILSDGEIVVSGYSWLGSGNDTIRVPALAMDGRNVIVEVGGGKDTFNGEPIV